MFRYRFQLRLVVFCFPSNDQLPQVCNELLCHGVYCTGRARSWISTWCTCLLVCFWPEATMYGVWIYGDVWYAYIHLVIRHVLIPCPVAAESPLVCKIFCFQIIRPNQDVDPHPTWHSSLIWLRNKNPAPAFFKTPRPLTAPLEAWSWPWNGTAVRWKPCSAWHTGRWEIYRWYTNRHDIELYR